MNRVISESLTVAVASGLVPAAVVKACYDPKWRSALGERFGGGDWAEARRSLERPVWVHAASVGEVGGVSPLLRRLAEDDNCPEILLSTTSLTGKAEARKLGLASTSCLLPFDHPSFLRKIIAEIEPRLFLISETEIWPNLLFSLERYQVPVVLINGRISDYSFSRYRQLRALLSPALLTISTFMVQTELDAERFEAIGVPASRISVAGSTKYDFDLVECSEAERAALAEQFGIDYSLPCFVAGSVHDKEDEIVLKAYLKALEHVPDLQLVIAPRHPERFEAVAKLLESYALEYNRRSGAAPLPKRSILLLDTLGELRKTYALATVAFVGGSLVDVGGHNPFEPAAYKTPVIVGPKTSTVRDAIASLKREGGVVEVTSVEDMSSELVQFCQNHDKRRSTGLSAYSVWQKNVGASDRVLGSIRTYL